MYESAEYLKATEGGERETLEAHKHLSIAITPSCNSGDLVSTRPTFINHKSYQSTRRCLEVVVVTMGLSA